MKRRGVDFRANATARERMKKGKCKKRPTGGKLRQCGFCEKRVDKCSCYGEAAPTGKLSVREQQKFCRFVQGDNRRRYFGDCLDVVLVCNWCKEFTINGGSFGCAVMAMFMFRFSNRVSTWQCIVKCFQTRKASPDFDVLEEELENHAEKLHKAFAIPVTVRDSEGKIVGENVVENAMMTFQSMWLHVSFRRLVKLLENGVKNVKEFADMRQQCAVLRECYKDALGTYRLKNNMDLWMYIGMVWKDAVNWWPVAKGSGT